MRLIECVPNISEGRDKTKIKEILTELKSVKGVELLNCEMGQSANRTVITFVAPKDIVSKAAISLIKKSIELIDMSKHHGVHPRIGCVDVCPFIPLRKTTLEDCAEIAKNVAHTVGTDFGVPVYLYGSSASKLQNRELSFLRKGGYENLEEKLIACPPDFGPNTLTETVKKSGALCIGARNFLLAYNINLDTKDLEITKLIAKELRAKLLGIKTLGWYIEEYGMCQISINIENYKKAPLYLVYEICKNIAGKSNIKVTGSELIGMAPKDAILDTAKFYLNKQGRIMPGIPHEEIFNLVIKNLNLNQIAPFIPENKIIELKLKNLSN
ncbi:MAG: glutamate formimidoyltransferase [Elusimicrobiaceae bacterium]|nr:glutamate formimidoyltransferase [Elusimicrobiaceae bacterium]